MTTDLTKITTAFGLLDDETKAALRACDGDIEIYGMDGDWLQLKSIAWNPNAIYRAKPQPATKPSVDWSMLQEQWRFIARDADGEIYAFMDRPEASGDCWFYDDACDGEGYYIRIDDLLAIDPGTCDWLDSLVERPE